MKQGLILIPFLLCAATVCFADDITLTFTAAGPNSIAGFYTFPYQTQLSTGATVQAMCDDFTNEISNGESWLASANVLDSANVPDFLYGSDKLFGGGKSTEVPTTALAAYDEAGYIFTGMLSNTISATEGNLAVWYLFSPGAAGSAISGDTKALGILDDAYTAVSGNASFDYSNIVVYTPDPFNSSSSAYTPGSGNYVGHAYPQEFMADAPEAPEPPPSVLMAAGAALIGLVSLTRRKRAAAAAIIPARGAGE